jgi:hypothetical protein
VLWPGSCLGLGGGSGAAIWKLFVCCAVNGSAEGGGAVECAAVTA